VTEEQLSAGQGAAAAGHTEGAGSTGDERAAIVIVDRDDNQQETLYQELSKRYSADYRIVRLHNPAELAARMRELLATGTPIALVIGGAGRADPDGIEVLAGIRDIDPTVPRVAAVEWGEWGTARPIFEAITTGKIDHWVTRPVQSPDQVRAVGTD
jgi:thioredoxin reductase (NADPH)